MAPNGIMGRMWPPMCPMGRKWPPMCTMGRKWPPMVAMEEHNTRWIPCEEHNSQYFATWLGNYGHLATYTHYSKADFGRGAEHGGWHNRPPRPMGRKWPPMCPMGRKWPPMCTMGRMWPRGHILPMIQNILMTSSCCPKINCRILFK